MRKQATNGRSVLMHINVERHIGANNQKFTYQLIDSELSVRDLGVLVVDSLIKVTT